MSPRSRGTTARCRFLLPPSHSFHLLNPPPPPASFPGVDQSSFAEFKDSGPACPALSNRSQIPKHTHTHFIAFLSEAQLLLCNPEGRKGASEKGEAKGLIRCCFPARKLPQDGATSPAGRPRPGPGHASVADAGRFLREGAAPSPGPRAAGERRDRPRSQPGPGRGAPRLGGQHRAGGPAQPCGRWPARAGKRGGGRAAGTSRLLGSPPFPAPALPSSSTFAPSLVAPFLNLPAALLPDTGFNSGRERLACWTLDLAHS